MAWSTVDPQLVFHTPGWDQQVIDDLVGNRSKEMSIESSVAVWSNTVYFANSGGLVSGWDLGPLFAGGQPVQTFRFWSGDDTDASVVIDDEGFLYVAVEFERDNARGRDVGQMLKLDPRVPDDPLVWSYRDQGAVPAGFWATPAVLDTVVINATDGARSWHWTGPPGRSSGASGYPGPPGNRLLWWTTPWCRATARAPCTATTWPTRGRNPTERWSVASEDASSRPQRYGKDGSSWEHGPVASSRSATTPCRQARRPIRSGMGLRRWWRRWESNPRPPRCDRGALAS